MTKTASTGANDGKPATVVKDNYLPTDESRESLGIAGKWRTRPPAHARKSSGFAYPLGLQALGLQGRVTRKVGDHAAGGDRANTIAEIRSEMDAIQEQVVWLLCPGLKDGTETLHELPAVRERALQLLSIGSLIDHSQAAIVEAAIRWLQLAQALGRLNTRAAAPHNNAGSAGISAERPPTEIPR